MPHTSFSFRHAALCTLGSLFISLSLGIRVSAQAPTKTFSDVKTTDPAFAAIHFLRGQNLVSGYPDNTFKPNQEVDRAAALKMILAGRITDAEVNELKNPGFTDIPVGAWYTGYVAKAAQASIIDAPPAAKTFNGSRPVILAEFLKLLQLAQGMDPNSYGEIRLPLALDVTDPTEWYYKYFRLAIASSILQIDKAGNLNPTQKLTRGDVAVYVHRLLMYKQGKRTQALLSETEAELSGNVIANLSPDGLALANMARARATLAVRGALASQPNSNLIKGAVKVTEGFGSLVDAYQAGVAGQPDQVLMFTTKAYDSSIQAMKFTDELKTIATSMQQIAHNMAEEARALKAKTK